MLQAGRIHLPTNTPLYRLPGRPLSVSACQVPRNILDLNWELQPQIITTNGRRQTNSQEGRIWAGLFLLLVGAVLLLDQMGFPLPDWLFSWHAFLIALGLFIGFRHNFRGGLWLILILIGGALEVQDYYPYIELHRFLLPGILILCGLAFVLNPRGGPFSGRYQWKGHQWRSHQWKSEWKQDKYRWKYGVTVCLHQPHEGYSSEDYIVDATAFFGGVHKKIVSKDFKGGDITTIMGGTELDLTQADFTGIVKLDVVQIMGGYKDHRPPPLGSPLRNHRPFRRLRRQTAAAHRLQSGKTPDHRRNIHLRRHRTEKFLTQNHN